MTIRSGTLIIPTSSNAHLLTHTLLTSLHLTAATQRLLPPSLTLRLLSTPTLTATLTASAHVPIPSSFLFLVCLYMFPTGPSPPSSLPQFICPLPPSDNPRENVTQFPIIIVLRTL